MPRSNRPRRSARPTRATRHGGSGRGTRGGGPAEPRDLEASLTGLQRSETHPDGEWVVRRVTGAAATRAYVCPGCSQQITPGTAHVVAWPADGLTGAQSALEERRHWHSPCWQRRTRRRPG